MSPRQRRFGDQRGPKYGRLWTRVPAPRGLSRGAPGAHRGGLFVPDSKDTEAGGNQAAETATPLRERGEGGADSGRARRTRLPEGEAVSLAGGTGPHPWHLPLQPHRTQRAVGTWDTRGGEDTGVHTGAQLGHMQTGAWPHTKGTRTHTGTSRLRDTHTHTHRYTQSIPPTHPQGWGTPLRGEREVKKSRDASATVTPQQSTL